MSFTRNWIHCVWGTKNRIPYFTKSNKWEILKHIKENALTKDIYIDHINGGKDHIHVLISLKADQTLSKVVQLIKGESSFWINKNKLSKGKFSWAEEYFAVSVSQSQVFRVRDYIRNQEKHHENKSWDQEYTEFMKKYGFQTLSE